MFVVPPVNWLPDTVMVAAAATVPFDAKPVAENEAVPIVVLPLVNVTLPLGKAPMLSVLIVTVSVTLPDA
jgi:hypothetical protein